jgi:ABC-2 type transport system permease protein
VKAFAAQFRTELTLTLRRGESLLLILGIPILLLVFFSLVDVLPTGTEDPIDFLAPGILALAVMSTAMVSLGIATGFERSYKVLKRLGATPLGRPRLLGAKIASVVVIELVQFAILVPVAYAIGWSPSGPDWPLAALGVVVGTVAFAGLGLLLAGLLDGTVNLAAQNGLYLVLLLLGGMIIPFSELPVGLRAIARALPSGAMADVLRDALTGAGDRPGLSWLVLCAWAIAMPIAAAATFRWE